MATKKKTEEVEIITNLKINYCEFTIVGIAPLIVNCFGHGVEILDDNNESKEKGLKKAGKVKLTPEEEYEKSLYYLSDGVRTGSPAVGFKGAMVRAGKTCGEVMVDLRTKFHIIADDLETGLIEIHGNHRMRSDVVKVGGMTKTSSPRYRAEYPEWSAKIRIKYLDGVITPEKLATLLNTAGFCCGIGEWRPEKCNSGSFGLFQVAPTE